MNGDGQTALHFAAQNPHVDVLEFILEQELDLEKRDGDGYTALHIASVYQNLEGCKILLKRGAMIDSKTTRGKTPLRIAVKVDSFHCVQLFLEHGASLDGKALGKSIFEFAAADENATEVIRYLLMQYVARMEYSNLSIDKDDKELICNTDCYREYYQVCLKELQRMKEAKFYNNVSIFNILVGKKKVIAGYARNEEVVEALEKHNYKYEFPVYFSWLQRRFCAEVERQRLRKSAIKVLSDIFNLNDSFDAVNEKILSYIRDEDLMFLAM